MSNLSSASTNTELPRRSSSVFERSGNSVRRLARRISISVLRKDSGAATRPGSAASEYAVSRSGSRLGFGRRGRAATESEAVAPVVEVASETDVSVKAMKVPAARIVGRKRTYDVAPLVEGRRVPELWFPTGDTLVYLCSKEDAARYEPAFKVSSLTLRRKSEFFAIALSQRWQDGEVVLKALLEKERAEYVLYFPPWEDAEDDPRQNITSEQEMITISQQLLATRNLFAYLFGRSFVALEPPHEGNLLLDFIERLEMYILTTTRPPARAAILADVAAYIRHKELDDPRTNPTRLLSTLLLSSRYTMPTIFTESFVHASGLYPQLTAHPLFHLLPPQIRQLLELSSFSIAAKVHSTTSLLTTLKFPELDLTTPRRRHRTRPTNDDNTRSAPLPTPAGWQRAFLALREATMKYYTTLFRCGSWPPKKFTRGMVLQMHADFSAVHALLLAPPAPTEDTDPYRQLLLRVLEGYESRQSHPQTPTLPRLPKLPRQGSAQWNKKQSSEAAALVLLESYGVDVSNRASEGFVEVFKALEREYGRGRTVTKSLEAREGRWCFVYVVLRGLREVVGEGEWDGLRYGWGCEYWLCAEVEKAREVLAGVGVGAVRGEVEDDDDDDDDDEDSSYKEFEAGVVQTSGERAPERRAGASIFGAG